MKPFIAALLSAVALLFAIQTHAQIVYTDVTPDVTTTGTYNLDLDNNGSTDFVIKHTTSTANGGQHCSGSQTNQFLKISPSNGNSVADNTAGYPTNASVYSSIDATTAGWSNTNGQVLRTVTWSCQPVPFGGNNYAWWNATTGAFGGSDGLVTLKLVSSSSTYYGWVRIANNGSSFTVKDYAYNSAASQPILAGQVSENYVTVGTVVSVCCAGGNLSVPFVIHGTFNASNVVTVELSDANGSFTNPVVIGSTVAGVSGSIAATVPAQTAVGNYYRVRVTTTSPARVSYANETNLAVVNLQPSGTIVAYGSTNLCDGNVQLSAPNTYGYTYQWKLNGSNIANANGSSYTATAVGNYTCQISTACASIASNAVAVTSTASVPAITCGLTSVCSGNSTYIVNSSAYTNSFQWKLNGAVIPGATDIGYSTFSAGNYTCVRTNACGSATSNGVSISVNPNPAAAINTTYTSPVCSGTVALNANTGAGLIYQWQAGDTYNYGYYNDIAGATNASYSATTSGTYRVVETNSAGCTATAWTTPSLIEIGLNAYISAYTTTICQGSSNLIELDAIVTSNSPLIFQWYRGGTAISGATNAAYATNNPGSYTVAVTRTTDGCAKTSAAVSLVKVHCRMSEDDDAVNTQLSVYPNPVTNAATISFSVSSAQRVSANVFDVDGRRVATLADGMFDAGDNTLAWDATEVVAGVYFLQVQSAEKILTQKIIISR